MKFIENNTYTLQTDYYNSVKLKCTWSTGTEVYFVGDSNGVANYKLEKKSNKLYQWNLNYSSWDTIENTLSEETVEDVWSKRMANGSDYYSGVGQGD